MLLIPWWIQIDNLRISHNAVSALTDTYSFAMPFTNRLVPTHRFRSLDPWLCHLLMGKPKDPEIHLYVLVRRGDLTQITVRMYTARGSRTLSAAFLHGNCMVSRVKESTCGSVFGKDFSSSKSVAFNSERVYNHGIYWPPRSSGGTTLPRLSDRRKKSYPLRLPFP